MKRIILCAAAMLAAGSASAVTLVANTTITNGGSANWGMFFDLSTTSELSVTGLTTASTALAGASFSVQVFTFAGSALGIAGANSTAVGWTLLGSANATQGATSTGVSLLIDIPDIVVTPASPVGVALVFSGAGPRYFGTGAAPLQTFTDGMLSLTTGDARSVPFTSGGSYFSSRGLTGSLVYSPVPEPSVYLMLALGLGGLALRMRQQR